MSSSKYEMEAENAPQTDVVQQQQIQTLLANMEELTHQNEEESNSQANRRDRTSREDSTRVENELRNIRKDMDDLKSAMKDKGRKNLDGMIRRTDSPFITEVLNRPLPPKFCLPQLESYDDSKDPYDHIESFKTLMLLEITLDEVMCRAFLTTLKGATRV